jgi:hypothetical protein
MLEDLTCRDHLMGSPRIRRFGPRISYLAKLGPDILKFGEYHLPRTSLNHRTGSLLTSCEQHCSWPDSP